MDFTSADRSSSLELALRAKRRLSESYSSDRSQDFLHRVSLGLFASLRIQYLLVLRDTTHLRYNFHNSHCILVVAFSSFLGDGRSFSAFCLVVRQPCDVGTNTYLLPYIPIRF